MEVHFYIPHLSVKELPTLRQRDERLWDLNRLFICLVYENRAHFIAGLKLIAEKRPTDLCKLFTCIGFLLWQLDAWLNASVKETLYQAIEQLQLMENSVITPELADIFENYRKRFNYWHGKRYKNIMEAIDALMPVQKIRHRNEVEHFDRAQCLDILIDWDVNVAKLIHNNRTAFYHAIECRNSMAMWKLLQKGSFIANQTNNASDLHICSVDANVLENHFNSCISACIDDDRFLEFDLKNLLAPRKDCRICDGTCSDEIQSIQLLANSNDHKHLLAHPLISSFLLLKWERCAPVLYIDFILYTIFALSTVGYVLAVAENMPRTIKMTMTVLTAVLTIYIAARRISHQIFCKTYKIERIRHKAVNVLQCCHTASIVVCVALLLFHVSENDILPIKLATICILLIALELFTLAGALFWSFSIYYTMFLQIALSTINCLQLYVIFLPAFALSFYLLLRERSVVSLAYNNHGTAQSNYQMNRGHNAFDHMRTSFAKTMAMSSAEFDAITSDFDANIWASILFLGFQFFVAIIFMNLLIALAVSDVTNIRANATEASLIRRIALMAHYERVKSYKSHWFR